MNDLNLHYRQLLGLSDDWKGADVNLDLDGTQVVIELSHIGGQLVCPECEAVCSKADTAPQRKWRHLDTMQFTTEIHAAIPRCNCAQCGVKTIAVPWAGQRTSSTVFSMQKMGFICQKYTMRWTDLVPLARVVWNRSQAVVQGTHLMGC